MGIKGRRVHMIEELSETIISFQRGKRAGKSRFVSLHNDESLSCTKNAYFIFLNLLGAFCLLKFV